MLWFAEQVAALKTASIPYLFAFYAVLSGVLVGVILRKILGVSDERKI